MTTGPKKPAIDTAAIDDGWDEVPEQPEPLIAPQSPPRGSKPAPREARPVAPVARPPLEVAGEEPPRDDIEYDGEAVTRDSMPTFPHPNPLQYDIVPPSQRNPKVPKPPPLPKFRNKQRR